MSTCAKGVKISIVKYNILAGSIYILDALNQFLLFLLTNIRNKTSLPCDGGEHLRDI